MYMPHWPYFFHSLPPFLPTEMEGQHQIYQFLQLPMHFQTNQQLISIKGCSQNSQQGGVPKQIQAKKQESEESDQDISEKAPPRYLHRKKEIKKKQKGKPERNALTNIGNQILTFIYLKKKNHEVIRRMFPGLTLEQLREYYLFAKDLKQRMYGYINFDKLTDLWHLRQGKDELNFRILRGLSHYYIREGLISAILTSKKMPIKAKPIHLKVRRRILAFFR